VKFRKIFVSHWLIIAIFALAAILRFWRLEALTTFGGDQGYDFLIVKRMIVDGKFTLLGPRIGPYIEGQSLYLGPAYYYLITPALFLFNLDPIGPAIFSALLSSLTVVIVYLISKEFFREEIAYIASGIFAIDSFFIIQSKASSNPHLIPFFSAIYIFSTFKIFKNAKSKFWFSFVSGLSLGIMFQLHYLAMVLAVPAMIFILLKKKFMAMAVLAAGFFAAITPQVIFELRHNFFILKLFLRNLSEGHIASLSNVLAKVVGSVKMLNDITFTNILLLPIFLLLITFSLKDSKDRILVIFLVISLIISIVSSSLFPQNLSPHYFAPIYVSITLLIAIGLFRLLKFSSRGKYIFVAILITFICFNATKLNLFAKEGYTMPAGWNLKGEKKAAEIIVKDPDSLKKFNIAATLDGDTRAMPYRYLVEIKGKIPQDVEAYPQSEVIYLISKDDRQTIQKYSVWEVSSFRPFSVEQLAEIQNSIKIYKLKRI